MKNKENTFIPMQCPNCNGKLEKTSDAEEYFCPHCETTYYFTLAPKKTKKSPQKKSQTIYITNQTIIPKSDEHNIQEKEKDDQIYISLEKLFRIPNVPLISSFIIGFLLAFKVLSVLPLGSFSLYLFLLFLLLGLFLSFIWLLILKLFFQLFIQYNNTDDVLGLLKYHFNKLKNLIHKH